MYTYSRINNTISPVHFLMLVAGLWLCTPLSAFAAFSLSGTLYQNDGTTVITTGKTITAAVGTSTPSLHSATSNGSGVFTISGIATSTGGTSWSTTTAASNDDSWQEVAYGAGRFVAIGPTTGDRVMYSDDGITWVTTNDSGGNNGWNSITYGAGLFVAVGSSGDRVMTSPDGVNWTARTAAGNNDSWQSVTYGGGLFVAVGTSGDKIMTSVDGITWVAQSTPHSSDAWYAVAYDAGRFVAVGAGTTYAAAYSANGSTWTGVSVAGNDDVWRTVTYGDDTWVALGSYNNRAMYSTNNGDSWATTTIAGDNDGWFDVLYVNGVFVAVSCGPDDFVSCSTNVEDRVATSSDGISWTSVSAAGNNDIWQGLAYGDGKLVVVGNSGDRVMYSSAGFGELTPITLYVNGSSERATTLTYGPTLGISSATNLHLFQDTVRIDHHQTDGVISVGLGGFYDYDDDNDILIDSDAATTTLGSTATAPDLVIAADTDFQVPTKLYLYDDYNNAGNVLADGSEIIFAGVGVQVATGTLSGTDSFDDLTITNTSQNGSTAQSVQFGAPLSTTGAFTMVASTSAQFLAGSLNEVASVDIEGTTSSPVWLRSSSNGIQFDLGIVSSSRIVTGVNVKDSKAVNEIGAITSTNAGNNTNWLFVKDWNDTDWTQYETITIQEENIDADLTNFPVFVDLSDFSNTFWSVVADDGGDIRITTDTGTPTELPREVVTIATTTKTGELHFKAPAISSTTDTVFRVYFNGNAFDHPDTYTYGRNNVWTEYMAVWHMNTDLSNTVDLANAAMGPSSPSGGTNTADNGMHFRITDDIRLGSTTIRTGASGNTTIGIYKFDPETQDPKEGTLVDSQSFTGLINGTQTIYLGLETNGPGDYWLGRTTGTLSMYRTTTDVTLPNRPGVSFMRGMMGDGSTTNERLYYFFNLYVESLDDSVPVPYFLDATGNGYDVLNESIAEEISTGKLGPAQLFEFNAYGDSQAGLVTPSGDATISYWFNTDRDASWRLLNSSSNYITGIEHTSSTTVQINNVSDLTTTPSYVNDRWYHQVIRKNDSNLYELFVDGSNESSVTSSANVSVDRIGGVGSGSSFDDYAGQADEVRIADQDFSTAWIKAEFINQSTTTDFYATGTQPAGAVDITLTNHDAGQANNAFSALNKTNESLFAFKLIPDGGSATITNMVITVDGVKKVEQGDFTNLRLFRDHDADGNYDASDAAVGGAGSLSMSDQTGTLTFTTDFLATTTRNYIVIADFNAPDLGSFMRMSLSPTNISAVDTQGSITPTGSVYTIQHHRNNRGGGGSAADDIGGAPPQGGGQQSGGGSGGGEQIGSDPNYRQPTASNGGSWFTPQNAYDAIDGTYAINSGSSETRNYTSIGYSIPAGNEIVGIEVKLEAKSDTASESTLSALLSWNNGSNFTSPKTHTGFLATSDTVYTLGGPSDIWGRSWTVSEFNNGNFVLRLSGTPGLGVISVDEIQVRVYYQVSGGGGGGGGDI